MARTPKQRIQARIFAQEVKIARAKMAIKRHKTKMKQLRKKKGRRA